MYFFVEVFHARGRKDRGEMIVGRQKDVGRCGMQCCLDAMAFDLRWRNFQEHLTTSGSNVC